MIIGHPETEPPKTEDHARCVCYCREGDDHVSQQDLAEDATGIIDAHDLDGPYWFIDDSPETLLSDRRGGVQLMESLRPTDHLVIALNAVPNVYDCCITLRRLMRRCACVHIVDPDANLLYEGTEALLLATEDYILHLQREACTTQ